MTDPVRLSKRLVTQLSCSRREAELYIEGGWVLVDGEVVDEPQFMVGEQTVELHPDASLEPVAPATILLHKPVGYDSEDGVQPARLLITPESRWAEDRSGIRVLKRHFARLTAPAVLERESSGLVVYTQDWHVARKLTEEAERLEHECIVEVSGTLEPKELALLNHGLVFKGWALPPARVSWQSETRLRFAIKGPLPYQIEWMCRQVGLTMLSLRRIRLGRMPMAGLPAGQWRYVQGYERF
jgi:23S rRNA pseudouridine2604 synthase